MNQELWASEFSTEMPEGCTYEQFASARDAKWKADNMESDVLIAKQMTEYLKTDVAREYYETELTSAIGRIQDGRL